MQGRGRDAAGIGGREISRKLIHVLTSLSAAVLIARLPTEASRILFPAAFLVALAVEAARRKSTAIANLFTRAFGGMLRVRERHGITGATTLAAGFALAVLTTPPTFAMAGVLGAGIGDAAAALVGRKFGHHRFNSGKSLEGTLACLTSTFVVLWAVGLTPVSAIACAIGVAVVELLPLPADDNLFLPLTGALLAWGAAVRPL